MVTEYCNHYYCTIAKLFFLAANCRWFTIGSVVYAVTSLVVFINSYIPVLGEDDSTLSRFRFRASWLLMVVSGLFFTLGSLAFIRAMHDDPPMRALFPNIYHMQSDELLGSWLFLLGTVIFIPYCMIFVAGTTSKLLYLGLLVVSVIVTFGTYLFVRACYPTEEEVRISFGYSLLILFIDGLLSLIFYFTFRV